MADHTPPTPEDARDRKILADIERVGWAVIAIDEDLHGPTYAFSVGLYQTLNHPEILLMGLRPQIAQQLINGMGKAIRANQRYEVGDYYDNITDGPPLTFVKIAPRHYKTYLGYAGWYNRGNDFPALQCIWPDKQNLFPWQDNYDVRFFQAQRLLGPVGDFHDGWLFPDPPNLSVLTVRQVFADHQPILLASHDDNDEGWQFLPGGPCEMDDSLLVSLAAVLRHDPSIVELADLPRGWRAHRSSTAEPWQREVIAEKE